MKYILVLIGVIIILLLGIIVLNGYAHNQINNTKINQYIIKFDDLGDDVLNYENCFKINKISCDNEKTCQYFRFNKVICDNGVCLC